MKCPTCGKWTEVLETRARSDGSCRRRYQCATLIKSHRFSTVERIEKLKVGGLRDGAKRNQRGRFSTATETESVTSIPPRADLLTPRLLMPAKL